MKRDSGSTFKKDEGITFVEQKMSPLKVDVFSSSSTGDGKVHHLLLKKRSSSSSNIVSVANSAQKHV